MKLNQDKLVDLMVNRYGNNGTNISDKMNDDFIFDEYGTGKDNSKSMETIRHIFMNDLEAIEIQRHKLWQKPSTDIAYLVIRFEDLLFRPKELAQRVCNCAGGQPKPMGEMVILEAPAKRHGYSNNRSQALEKYRNPKHRYSLYSHQDLKFMEKALNQKMLEMFGYKVDWNIYRIIEQENVKGG